MWNFKDILKTKRGNVNHHEHIAQLAVLPSPTDLSSSNALDYIDLTSNEVDLSSKVRISNRARNTNITSEEKISKENTYSFIDNDLPASLGPIKEAVLPTTDKYAEILSIDPLKNNLSSLSVERDELALHTNIITPVHRIQDSNNNWWIKAFVQGDNNLVYSSFDKFYNVSGYETTALGLSGGLGIVKEFDRFEVETGLSYSTKSYVPEIINETYRSDDGYHRTSLQRIFFNVISVPLNLNLKYFEGERFNLYSTVGLSANLVINSHYDIEDNIIPFPTSPAITPTNAVLEDKPFERGLLEGGSLLDNAYLSMNFGAGVNYNLSDRVELSLFSLYQGNIFNAGIGPNEDRINSISLGLGTRVRI